MLDRRPSQAATTGQDVSSPLRGRITPLGEGDVCGRQAIEEIFFQSSAVTDFEDPDQKAAFFHLWTGYYLRREPEQVRLYRLVDGTVAGYLMGCLNSRAAEPLYQDIASYGLFASYFQRFPAHLHVNCHPAHRCKGIGAALVRDFLGRCREEALSGVHVVTAAGARNLAFYRRLGFEALDERDFQGIRRLLLGLRLAPPSLPHQTTG